MTLIMNLINKFLLNYYFLIFIFSWITSVLIKATLKTVNKKRFNLKDGFQNGGMPSSHAAVVSAMTFGLLFKTGLSELFFLSMVFSAIIISDAFILRQNVGLQGEKLNHLLTKNNESTIKIVYGHTFLQVIAGCLLGLFISSILFILL